MKHTISAQPTHYLQFNPISAQSTHYSTHLSPQPGSTQPDLRGVCAAVLFAGKRASYSNLSWAVAKCQGRMMSHLKILNTPANLGRLGLDSFYLSLLETTLILTDRKTDREGAWTVLVWYNRSWSLILLYSYVVYQLSVWTMLQIGVSC